MRRANFLKMLGVTLLPGQEKLFGTEGIPDPLLEEFEDAGIEEKFQRREEAFWLDTMIQDAWEEGREVRFALLDPEAWKETMIQAGVAFEGSSTRTSWVYVSDFGTVRLLHAREWPWVELNEHGAWLLDELPQMYPSGTVCYSGGLLNGKTSRAPGVMTHLYEAPYRDPITGRTRRVPYIRYKHSINHPTHGGPGTETIIVVPA